MIIWKHPGQCFVQKRRLEDVWKNFLFILWRASCRKAFQISQRSFDLRGFSCKAEMAMISSSSKGGWSDQIWPKTCKIYDATMLSITGSTNYSSWRKCPSLESHQCLPLNWLIIALQHGFYRKSCPPLHRSFFPPCCLCKAGKREYFVHR